MKRTGGANTLPYTIRYFQFEGRHAAKMAGGIILPAQRPLPGKNDKFELYLRQMATGAQLRRRWWRTRRLQKFYGWNLTSTTRCRVGTTFRQIIPAGKLQTSAKMMRAFMAITLFAAGGLLPCHTGQYQGTVERAAIYRLRRSVGSSLARSILKVALGKTSPYVGSMDCCSLAGERYSARMTKTTGGRAAGKDCGSSHVPPVRA